MFRAIISVIGLVLMPSAAQAYTKVEDQASFLSLVEGRTLSRPLARLTLEPGGQVSGTATGSRLEGRWQWEGTAFCWEAEVGSVPWMEYTCLDVYVDGAQISFREAGNPGNRLDFTIQ